MNPDRIIAILSDFSQFLVELRDRYKELLPLVSEEHRLLQSSDLSALENLTKTKTQVCDQIIKLTLNVQKFGQDLFPENPEPLRNISEIVESLEEKFNIEGLKQHVVSHLIREIKLNLGEMKRLRDHSQSKIEMNIYLTKKILNHHRKAYELWNDVAEKSAGVYTPAGQHSNRDISPILRIKA